MQMLYNNNYEAMTSNAQVIIYIMGIGIICSDQTWSDMSGHDGQTKKFCIDISVEKNVAI